MNAVRSFQAHSFQSSPAPPRRSGSAKNRKAAALPSAYPGAGGFFGAFAFNALTIQELTIPTSVENIGCCAFAGQKVRRLMLPEGLRCVEPLAFMTEMDDDAEMELYIRVRLRSNTAAYWITTIR